LKYSTALKTAICIIFPSSAHDKKHKVGGRMQTRKN
jgi:hypothetical protein